MFGVVTVLVLSLVPPGASPQVPTARAAAVQSEEGARAAAERVFADRQQSCRSAPDGLAAWPPGDRFRYRFETFFVQGVDDRLAGELEGHERRLVLGALLPLGLAVEPDLEGSGNPQLPLLEVVGVGQALPPESVTEQRVYTGAAWKGLVALHAGGKCLAAIAFNARLRPPDAVVTVAVEDASAAPYLEAIEAAVLEPLVRLVAALRGEVGLSRLALSEADWRLRTGAVEQLTNQGLLAGVARAAKAPWLRIAAVGKLTNQARLDEIAQNDKDAEVRKAALDRLAELARRGGH